MTPNRRDLLREQTDFLRRLARGLLYDRASADDAVQEAWLVALRRRTEGPGPTRAWLAGVVRNVVRQSARTADRRSRREREAAAGEATVSAADSVERIERMRRVADAVEALDEPYRATILLRYADGLPPREIARRHGLPVETVRTRLKRGLARLRATLDGDGRGSREALLGALVPWAGRPPLDLVLATHGSGGPATTCAPWKGAGVVLMGKAAAVWVTVAAIGTAVWLGARGGPGESGERPPRAAVGTATARGASGAEAAAEGASAPPERIPAEAARPPVGPSWRIAGRAFLHGRTPAPEVAIRLAVSAARAAAARTAVVRTDSAGRFEWRGEGFAAGGWIDLGAADDDVFSYGETAWVPPGIPGAEGLTLRLHPIDVRLAGVVVDEARRPIEGAEVRTLPGRTRSDGEGRFEVEGSSTTGGVAITAWAAGRAKVRIRAETGGPGRVDGLEIVLRESLRIVGRVADADGDPIVGATVRTILSDGEPVSTDGDGEYVLDHLDPGRPRWLVTVQAAGHRAEESWVDTPGAADVRHDVTLEVGATVRGRVLDEAGAPIEGALVALGPFVGARTAVSGTSGPEGLFVLEHAPPGAMTLTAVRPGHAAAAARVDVPEEGDRDGVEVRLGRSHHVGGVVVDPRGRPVDAAIVQAIADGDVAAPNARTDEEGRFRLVDVPASATGLRVVASGFAEWTGPAGRFDGDDRRIELIPAGRLGGRVVDAVTGAPVPRFTIRLVAPTLAPGEAAAPLEASWAREGHAFRSPDGSWIAAAPWVAPGDVFGVEVSAPGYAPATERHVVAAGPDDPLPLVLRLGRGASVVGTIVARGTGVPLEGARVRTYAIDETVPAADDGVHGRRPARSDARGRFEIGGVPAGRTRLLVETPDGEVVDDGPFDVPRSGVVERRIEVRAPGVLTGTVEDEAGRPVAGATVVIAEIGERGETSRDRRTTTNESGRFRVEGIPGGRYVVVRTESAGAVHATLLAAGIRLEDGGERDVTLRPRGRGRIEGTLETVEGAPAPPVAVEAVRGGVLASRDPVAAAAGVRGCVAEGGRFALAGLEPGRWTVTARSAAGARATVEVEVSATRTAEVTLILGRP